MNAHAVGSIVESICGKCNDVMGHTIMAMVSGKIVKVECRICKSVHRYRPAARAAGGKEALTLKKGRDGAPAPSRQAAMAPASRPAAPKKAPVRKMDLALAQQQAWQKAMREHDAAASIPYAISGSFVAGDIIDHPVFGAGLVTAVVVPDKMDVLFESGPKRLLGNKQ